MNVSCHFKYGVNLVDIRWSWLVWCVPSVIVWHAPCGISPLRGVGVGWVSWQVAWLFSSYVVWLHISFTAGGGGGDGESCFCVTSFVRLLLHLCCTFILHWCCTCYYYIVIVIVLFLLLLYSCCTVFVCALCSSWYCGFLGRWYFGIPWNPLLAWLSRDLTVPGGGSGSRGPRVSGLGSCYNQARL